MNELDATVKGIHDSLVEFGYSNLEIEHTREEVIRVLTDQKPAGIIGMMAKRQIAELEEELGRPLKARELAKQEVNG